MRMTESGAFLRALRDYRKYRNTEEGKELLKTLHAICANVLRELIDKGVERLTPEELAALKELHGLPTPATYNKALEPYA
ncbi:MAG: hypothetical protein IKZ07_06035 [Akkermansia sp.]|nr:hypothetical protein [Akkermansia sp.]